MAKKTVAELKAEVTAVQTQMNILLANNTTGQITPEKIRQVFSSVSLTLTDICDSFEALP